MDVCRPPLLWIGNSCYRKNPFMETTCYENKSYTDTQDKYDDEVGPSDQMMEEEQAGYVPVDVQELANGRFKASIHVANVYFAPIIGKKGSTKQRIERETKTQIQVPKVGAEDTQNIIVTGITKGSVVSACNRIYVIAQSSRNRQPFTHFVSIPLNTKSFQEQFLQFKEDVLRQCDGISGLDETIFQDPGLLHLTVCTVALMDSVERQKAIELLQDCKEELLLPALGENALEIQVEGLEIMNDDQSEVDVLYAKVLPIDGNDVLQKVCDQIVNKFVESGIAQRQYDHVKLHLTLMNSVFRKESDGIGENENEKRGQRKDGTKRETFDARRIFEKFGNRKFGRAKIDQIHLSQRWVKKRDKDNYYMPSVVVSLTSCG